MNKFKFFRAQTYSTYVGGVAMGSKMVPKYACLFLGYVEEQIVSQCDDFLPQLHKRFIDDVIEAPVVAVWNLTITSTSYPTFIPLFNLRTPFLTLNSPSSTPRYAATTTSAIPFITRKLIHTLTFITIITP